MVSDNIYQVIPFDNSEIIFCPIVDLWGMSDDRRNDYGKSQFVKGRPIGKEHFLSVNYNKDFTIPVDELEGIRSQFNLGGPDTGYEFFTSSPCLLVYENKLDWFHNNI